MGAVYDKLVIIGDGEFAEIAYEYFTHDSAYNVEAFSVEKQYLKRETLFGLPVVPFEDLENIYDPREYKIFVAITFVQLNRLRTRLFEAALKKGFSAASYVSSKAFVWHNVKIGQNCFIFENNVLQYHVKVGNNVIVWSGNHIGHRSVIKDNSFIASHVVISGYCEIGESCFIGVNVALNDQIKVQRDCVIGSGANIIKNTKPGKVYTGNPAKPGRSSFEAFGVEESEI